MTPPKTPPRAPASSPLRGLLADGRFWDWMLLTTAVSRAVSYCVRPPADTPTSRLLEELLSYTAWSALLLTLAALIMIGTIRPRLRRCAWVGHVLGVVFYGYFTISTILAAVLHQQPWAGTGLMVIGGTLHFARVIWISDEAQIAKADR